MKYTFCGEFNYDYRLMLYYNDITTVTKLNKWKECW